MTFMIEYSSDYKKDFKTAYLAEEYERLQFEIEESLKTGESHPELLEMAQEEIVQKKERQEQILAEIEMILAKDKEEASKPRALVLEFRAGTGGDEAHLFAQDLKEMYQKYADQHGWSVKVLDELTLEIDSPKAYDALRYETGVHRVQRVPATEKSGRIHTSTASVAVLPLRDKPSVEINMADIDMEFSRSGGAGGQNVNKVESAVRLVHRPTGLEVRSTSERSQLGNRTKALAILTAKIEALHEEQEAKKHALERKNQIGTGDRSEKIRTYNYLQDRVTDHRIKMSFHNLPKIMLGSLDPIMEALSKSAETGEVGSESED